MPQGFLCVLLHAHLPFIRHPEYEDSLEERWLFEALTETYLPLLDMLEGRAARGAKGRITVSLSPTLLAMFEDPLLRRRYAWHMGRLVELAEREVARTPNDPRFYPAPLAAPLARLGGRPRPRGRRRGFTVRGSGQALLAARVTAHG